MAGGQSQEAQSGWIERSNWETPQLPATIWESSKNSELTWLLVLTILKNMKVNGKDDIPYMMENKIHVWNHQPGSIGVINVVIMPKNNCLLGFNSARKKQWR